MANYSLKKKLKKSLFIQLIVMMLLMLLMLFYFTQQILKEQLLTHLQHDAESLITIIQQKNGQWFIDPTHISAVYNRVRSGHYYIIQVADQTIRSRSLFDSDVTIPALVDTPVRNYQMPGSGHETWLVWQQKIYKDDLAYVLWVAEDISPIEQSVIYYGWIAFVIILLFSILFILLQLKILDHAFKVFDTLRENLDHIRQGNKKPTGSLTPQEIEPLVFEIEKLVNQLSQRIQRTRSAIGNLVHEVKRPLQLLSLYIDGESDKETGKQSLEDIQLIVDRELRRARISGSNVIGGFFVLSQELPSLLDVLQKIYPNIEFNFKDLSQDKPLAIDRDDMLELLGNILDNAAKFATKQVKGKALIESGTLHLIIEDDGAGVLAAQLNKITQKGYRLDEVVQGHGLGLSICSDIVNSYQGVLNFKASSMGGLAVYIDIPLPN